jgi:hypothetical protein
MLPHFPNECNSHNHHKPQLHNPTLATLTSQKEKRKKKENPPPTPSLERRKGKEPRKKKGKLQPSNIRRTKG